MSVTKCILQFGMTGRSYPDGVKPTCGKAVIPGAVTCGDCAPTDKRYAMRFYRSCLRNQNHDIRHSLGMFPWKTCGQPAEDAIDLATLESGMIKAVQDVERAHSRWFWLADSVKTRMCYSTGSYVHDLTDAQVQELRDLRAVKMPECVDNPRCVKDCVIDCQCHPWYGIVLTADGTKADTILNPEPDTPYVKCIDCWHKCCASQRAKGDPWVQHKTWDSIPLWPEVASSCAKCLDKPVRRRVWNWLDGYYMC